MKRLLAIAVIIPIAACTPQQFGSVIGVVGAVSPETVTRLVQVCRQGQPLIGAATSPAMPVQVRDIAMYVSAYCGQLLAGTTPPTTDGNTVGWLDRNLAILQGLLIR